MTSVIIGDIIHSRKASPALWLEKLKSELKLAGRNPKTWEVFMGDSFEVEVKNSQLALLTAIKIKASIKTIKKLDVRMAIGIGEKTFNARRITESNGPVFVYSGHLFESLVRENQNLAVDSPWKEFNSEMNLLLRFACIAMDGWSANSAEIVHLALNNPGLSQKELGNILGIKQNSVSTRMKRAYFNEVSELLLYFQNRIKELHK